MGWLFCLDGLGFKEGFSMKEEIDWDDNSILNSWKGIVKYMSYHKDRLDEFIEICNLRSISDVESANRMLPWKISMDLLSGRIVVDCDNESYDINPYDFIVDFDAWKKINKRIDPEEVEVLKAEKLEKAYQNIIDLGGSMEDFYGYMRDTRQIGKGG